MVRMYRMVKVEYGMMVRMSLIVKVAEVGLLGCHEWLRWL